MPYGRSPFIMEEMERTWQFRKLLSLPERKEKCLNVLPSGHFAIQLHIREGLIFTEPEREFSPWILRQRGAVDKVSATVKGSRRNVYNTGFQYDAEADRLKEVYCDCLAFRSYSGICKHCVAVLMEYGDRKAYERVEARKQEEQAGEAALLLEYQERETSRQRRQ